MLEMIELLLQSIFKQFIIILKRIYKKIKKYVYISISSVILNYILVLYLMFTCKGAVISVIIILISLVYIIIMMCILSTIEQEKG